jgi:hypothetical protein
MAYLNFSDRSINFKICYADADDVGAYTNLAWLAAHVSRGTGIPLQRIDDAGQALWVTSAPLAPTVLSRPLVDQQFSGWAVLQAAPASSQAALRSAIQNCDALVFVAPPGRARLETTARAFGLLCTQVASAGYDFGDRPLVVQYGDRAAQDAAPIAILRDALLSVSPDAAGRCSQIEASASQGIGIAATLDRAVIAALATPRLTSYIENVLP